ncbi:MAG: DUF2911 domain-containing protein [Gemmatimonadaceae bacterium]
MKSIAIALSLTTLCTAVAAAQPGARRAAPSTRATTTVELTFADTAAQRAAGKPALVRIDYGQPHLRGRTINSENLVPYDQVWRLGANAATLLTTEAELTIGGTNVPAGRYIMQVLPTRNSWTLILQRETSGAAQVMLGQYEAGKDFARIPLRLSTLSVPVESFSIWLVPSTAPGAQTGVLTMAWGTVQLQADWAVR